MEIVKIFPEKTAALNYAENLLQEATEKAKVEYGISAEEEEEDSVREDIYVQLHGEKIFEKKVATYRRFYNPILAVVEVSRG